MLLHLNLSGGQNQHFSGYFGLLGLIYPLLLLSVYTDFSYFRLLVLTSNYVSIESRQRSIFSGTSKSKVADGVKVPPVGVLVAPARSRARNNGVFIDLGVSFSNASRARLDELSCALVAAHDGSISTSNYCLIQLLIRYLDKRFFLQFFKRIVA